MAKDRPVSGSFGKPNASGRSSGTLSGRERKMRSPPEGEPWVWMTRELLSSPSVRALSLTGRRLLDFLLIEHMSHAGTENGNLMATKDQLAAFGLSRRLIPGAINEVVFLGLARVERGRLTRGGVKAPNLFRLTFFADSTFAPPTNDWKGVTVEAIAKWKTDRTHARKTASLREDIKVGTQSGAGETATLQHLTRFQGSQSGAGNE